MGGVLREIRERQRERAGMVRHALAAQHEGLRIARQSAAEISLVPPEINRQRTAEAQSRTQEHLRSHAPASQASVGSHQPAADPAASEAAGSYGAAGNLLHGEAQHSLSQYGRIRLHASVPATAHPARADGDDTMDE